MNTLNPMSPAPTITQLRKEENKDKSSQWAAHEDQLIDARPQQRPHQPN